MLFMEHTRFIVQKNAERNIMISSHVRLDLQVAMLFEIQSFTEKAQ